jgi:hypothetical protein
LSDNILQSQNVTNALKEDRSIEDIFSFVALTVDTVDAFTYTNPDPNVSTVYCLKKGEFGFIKTFIHFVHYCKEIGNPIDDQWIAITQDELDQFRCNLDYIWRFGTLSNLTATVVPPTIPASNSTSASTLTSVSQSAPVDMFKHGIKLDPSVFPTLKDEPLNDQWHHIFANQAHAQDVSDVLDDSYVPTTSADIALFKKSRSTYMLFFKVKLKQQKAVYHLQV